MYKLYTDKTEIFECDIKLSGAAIKDSKARLVIESEDLTLLFSGDISESGKCKVPVKKLRNLLDENTKGNIKLEVIAEDTYFVPWESEFLIETSKKVTVEVKSQKTKPVIKESKKMVEVSGIKEITISERKHVINILKLLLKEKINIKNLSIKKNKLNNIIAEYKKENPIKETQTNKVVEKVVKVLAKKR